MNARFQTALVWKSFGEIGATNAKVKAALTALVSAIETAEQVVKDELGSSAKIAVKQRTVGYDETAKPATPVVPAAAVPAAIDPALIAAVIAAMQATTPKAKRK